MQLPTPILASGQGVPFLIAGALFLLGGAAGLFQRLRRHPFGYAVGAVISFALFGYLLIGGCGLLTPSALPLAYWYGRCA